MTNDTSATHQPAGEPRPTFAPPGQPTPPAPTSYGPPPAGYGAQPAPSQPTQPGQPVEHEWTADGLVAKPALPPERVGRGAALALLAVPAGALAAGIIDGLGYIGTISGIVTAVLAAVLYVRGSGGRVAKGIPVIIGVILLGIATSFFTVVAVDLWQAFPTIDADVAASYASRSDFVAQNLFYPPVLASDAHSLGLLILFSALGGIGTIVRLVRLNNTHAKV